MKIAYCGDLHLEFGMIELNNTENVDLLVLAGDIMLARDVGVPKYEWFFENCSNEFRNVIYIMGNHEYYNGEFNETQTRLRTLTDKFPNVHFLENEWVKLDNIIFYGGTFWTTSNNHDPHVIEHLSRGMNDFRIVKKGDKRFTPLDAAKVYDQAMDGLKVLLEDIKVLSDTQIPFDGEGLEKMVVVSHHAPSRNSIHPKYAADVEMNYGYFTDMEEFITKNPQIKLWFHGHVHTPFDYKIGETRVLCNPRGYIGHEQCADYFELKYVEV